jgi:hypothetical protein
MAIKSYRDLIVWQKALSFSTGCLQKLKDLSTAYQTNFPKMGAELTTDH